VASAYMLINCDNGSEEDVISHLKTIDGVIEVHGTFGAYDIIAEIESDNKKTLRDTVARKIRKIERIRSTLTLSITSQE
jgi:DNA-binding Lrp family transcriptional regulator